MLARVSIFLDVSPLMCFPFLFTVSRVGARAGMRLSMHREGKTGKQISVAVWDMGI